MCDRRQPCRRPSPLLVAGFCGPIAPGYPVGTLGTGKTRRSFLPSSWTTAWSGGLGHYQPVSSARALTEGPPVSPAVAASWSATGRARAVILNGNQGKGLVWPDFELYYPPFASRDSCFILLLTAMELSDEQKKKILEEEQARLAEEQYRTKVRRELQNQTGTAAAVPSKSKTMRCVLIVGGIVVLFCAGILAIRHLSRAGSELGSGPGPPTASSSAQVKGTDKLEKPSPLPPTKLTTTQIAELASPSVVVVENFNEDGQKTGQGDTPAPLPMPSCGPSCSAASSA